MNRFGIGTDSSSINSPIISHTQGSFAPMHGMAGWEEDQKKAGDLLSATISALTNSMALPDSVRGVGGNANKLAFRIGELLAKMDPRVAAKGWDYAGYQDQTVNDSSRGSSFTTAGGQVGKRTGIRNRMPAEWYERGRVGERLNIIKSITETASRLRRGLDTMSSAGDRMRMLDALFQQYLPAGYKNGLAPYGASGPLSPVNDQAFLAIMNAPRGSAAAAAPAATPASAPFASVASQVGNAAVGGFSAAVGQQALAQYEQQYQPQEQQAADGYGAYAPVEQGMSTTTKVIIGVSVIGLAVGAYFLTKEK
jgi:hypothetical protein